MPANTSFSKKEIRLKLAPKLYSFLSRNAGVYGIKPNEYIIHLVLDDIKNNSLQQIQYLSEESDNMIKEGYVEINELKGKGEFKGYNSEELMNKIFFR